MSETTSSQLPDPSSQEDTSGNQELGTRNSVEPAPEELVAARIALIEANDRDIADQLRRMSRRGFITLGAGAVAAIGAWKWLGSRDREGGLPWPLRRMLHLNEAVALSYFSTTH